MDKAIIKIGGMSCGHCIRSVEGALKGLEGVLAFEVAIGSANVSFDPSQVTEEQMKEAIEEEGYDVLSVLK